MREEGDGSTLGSLQAELDMLHKQLAARLARKEGAVTEQLVSAMSKASVEDMVEEESVSSAKKRTPVAEEAEKSPMLSESEPQLMAGKHKRPRAAKRIPSTGSETVPAPISHSAQAASAKQMVLSEGDLDGGGDSGESSTSKITEASKKAEKAANSFDFLLWAGAAGMGFAILFLFAMCSAITWKCIVGIWKRFVKNVTNFCKMCRNTALDLWESACDWAFWIQDRFYDIYGCLFG